MMAPFHHRRYLVNGFRQNNSKGKLAIGRQTIRVKSPHALGRVYDTVSRNNRPQGSANFIAPLNHIIIRFRHMHLPHSYAKLNMRLYTMT
jgi:hypothetical protein